MQSLLPSVSPCSTSGAKASCAMPVPRPQWAAQRHLRRSALKGQLPKHCPRAQGGSVSEVQQPELPPLWALDSSFPDSHSFSGYANWLIPGAVMLGRYPYVEPSRCFNVEQGEAQLDKILRAGITTFVSLQAELPPQTAMKLGGVDGFLPYKATAELIKSALAKPPPMEIINGLRNPTLDRFLPPRRRPIPGAEDPERLAAFTHPSYELNFLHFPMVDLGVPDSMEQVQALVLDLIARVSKGEKLYIHCWGGRGRAGLLGACLLREGYGISADEALARVQKGFDMRVDNKLRSPETEEQHAFVRAYMPVSAKM